MRSNFQERIASEVSPKRYCRKHASLNCEGTSGELRSTDPPFPLSVAASLGSSNAIPTFEYLRSLRIGHRSPMAAASRREHSITAEPEVLLGVLRGGTNYPATQRLGVTTRFCQSVFWLELGVRAQMSRGFLSRIPSGTSIAP